MSAGKVPGAFAHGKTFLVFERDLVDAMEQGRVGVAAEPEGNGPPVVTSREARGMLAQAGIVVSHVTVLDWLRKGVLPGEKIGKAWVIPRAELERMIAEGFETPKRGRPSSDESDV
jgi:hypothetical protein